MKGLIVLVAMVIPVMAPGALLNQWVTHGAGTRSSPWVVELSGVSTYLAADGKAVEVLAGYYHTTGPIVLSGTGTSLIGEGISSVIMSTDETLPVVRVTSLHAKVEDLWLRHEMLPAKTETGGYGLSVGNGSAKVAWGSFRNLYLTHNYVGVGEEFSFLGHSFNNIYSNVRVMYFSGWGVYLHQPASGDLFNSLYINNAWRIGVDIDPQPAVGLIYVYGDHDAVFNQLNLEHAVVSGQHPIWIGPGSISIDGLHVEGISYAHENPTGVNFIGTNSQVNFRNAVFNSIAVDSRQETFRLFRYSGKNIQVFLSGCKLLQDCSFKPTGGLYYNYLGANVDPGMATIEVRGFLDLSVSRFLLFGGREYSSSAIRRWNHMDGR